MQDQGPEALSLRDLARQAGVTHSAPRRHFPDRQALLDTLAEDAFRRVTDDLEAAARAAPHDPVSRFRAAAGAYVRFAAREARLHDLMFAMKSGEAPVPLQQEADRFFAVTADLLAPSAALNGDPGPDDGPRRLLVVACLQGLAALVASGRVPEDAVSSALDEAAHTFLGQ